MKFRLVYEGMLLSETKKGYLKDARATEKQKIRKYLHPQLRRLWEITPGLREAPPPKNPSMRGAEIARLRPEDHISGLSERFRLGKYGFVPLINRKMHTVCKIDVLFLRSDQPGAILSGGDIDNRLKTLFDGLSMPQNISQLGDFDIPEADESPFHCLLEDDSLITGASVETDTLLQPISSVPIENAARVIIKVETSVTTITPGGFVFM